MEQKKYQISKRPLYREEIREALIEAIVSGQLAPGDRIVETRWAKEFGVSQSPIREALRELELIGLVETIPYKGCIVRKITNKDLIDTFKVRIALESMAIEEAVEGDIDKTLELMQNKLKFMLEYAAEGDLKGFTEYDVQFHEAFVESSENEVLKRLWRQCYARDNTMLSAVLNNESLIELGHRHELLCDAMKSGDVNRAKKEIKAHFDMLIDDFSQ